MFFKDFLINNNIHIQAYLRHVPSLSDHVFRKIAGMNVNSQLNFLDKMRNLIELNGTEINPEKLKSGIYGVNDRAFTEDLKNEIFNRLMEMYRTKKKLFLSNKILPFSHPVRRRIFNAVKTAFGVPLRPAGYGKNRASNLHGDEIIEIFRRCSK